MASATDCSPNGRMQGDGTVVMNVECPLWSRAGNAAQLNPRLATTRAGHHYLPHLAIFLDEIDNFVIRIVGSVVNRSGLPPSLPERRPTPGPGPKSLNDLHELESLPVRVQACPAAAPCRRNRGIETQPDNDRRLPRDRRCCQKVTSADLRIQDSRRLESRACGTATPRHRSQRKWC